MLNVLGAVLMFGASTFVPQRPAKAVMPSMADLAWSLFPGDGYIPEGGLGIHDPAVFNFKGTYLFHTGPGVGSLRTSTDLQHWTERGPVIQPVPSWLQNAMPHHDTWAPEASQLGEGIRLYYCASARFGHNDSWIGVADCPHFNPARPTEGWTDHGPILHSKDGLDNFNAIDPDLLTDPTGRQWIYFGSYWSGLYVAEIDPTTGALLHQAPGSTKLIAKNPADRANGLEAPCCVYRDGYYYLFVNYGLAAQGVASTYRIVVGRSKTPDGPFLDAAGHDMVEGGHVDFLSSSPPMFGPGGGVEFTDNSGQWMISYHFYDARQRWGGRQWGAPTLQVRSIIWSDDGWPLPGLPVAPAAAKMKTLEQRSPAGRWIAQDDFGNLQPLQLEPSGTCLLGQNRGNWLCRGGDMTINFPQTDATTVENSLRCKLVYGGNYLVGRNGSGAVFRAIRKERSALW